MKNSKQQNLNFETLIPVFESYGINAKVIKAVFAHLKPLELNKGETFCVEGKKANRLGILMFGLLSAKYFNESKNEDVISRFYYIPKNIIVTSFESFQNNENTNETIEALDESYLAVIEREDLYALYDKYPELNKLGRQLAEQSYIQALKRIHQLQTMTVEQRLDDLINNTNGLISKLQIQHICSYVGTNRNSYSRIMNGKKRK